MTSSLRHQLKEWLQQSCRKICVNFSEEIWIIQTTIPARQKNRLWRIFDISQRDISSELEWFIWKIKGEWSPGKPGTVSTNFKYPTWISTNKESLISNIYDYYKTILQALMEPKMTPRGIFYYTFNMELVSHFTGQQLWGLLGFLLIHWHFLLLYHWCIGWKWKYCLYIIQGGKHRKKYRCR